MSGPLTGGCLCGGVRFELTAPPSSAGYCHCTRCQRRTGTAASPQARIDGRAFTNYAASWEPIPDDELERFGEARPRDEV